MTGEPTRPDSWSTIAEELSAPRNYWINTINQDGSPHATPVWGVIHEAEFYFYTSAASAKARNISRDPRMTVHLESAEHVLIVAGRAEARGAPTDSPGVLASLEAKYSQPGDANYLPSHDQSFDALFKLIPHKALAWQLATFDTSQRRWQATPA